MLNFQRYYTRMRPIVAEAEKDLGSYSQYFLDATSLWDAKDRAKHFFGPGWEVAEVDGPFENLEINQS